MSYLGNRVAGLVLVLVFAALTADATGQPASATPAREGPADASSGTAAIKGQVVDAATGRGLARVGLELNGGKPGSSASETTADDGTFVFSGLPAGRYSIQATKTSYDIARVPENRRGWAPKFLEVAAGATLDKVTIALVKSSAIAGRVVDRFGEPVQYATVSIRVFSGAGRPGRRFNGQFQTQTNDIGEFRLAPVPAGRYLLTARSQMEPFFRPSGVPNQPGFVAWPQVPALDQAEPLVVERGQTVSDLELQLYPFKPAKVSGVVVNADGTPAGAGTTIEVGFIADGEQQPSGSHGTQADNGRFELTLAPGTYDLTATQRRSPRAFGPPGSDAVPSASTRLTVSGEPIEGLVLTLAPAKTVSGRVVFAGSGAARPPDPAAVQLMLTGGRGCRFGQTSLRPDATFTFPTTGDRCRIEGSAGNGWQLRSVTQGTDEVMFEGIAIGERAVTDIVVTFVDRLTRLSAVVANAKGQPAEAFVVFIFPVDKARRPVPDVCCGSHAVAREAGPNRAGGPLRFGGLLPGDYFAIAIDPDDYDATGVPDSYDALEPLAQRFSLGDGEVRTLSLTIVDLPDSP